MVTTFDSSCLRPLGPRWREMAGAILRFHKILLSGEREGVQSGRKPREFKGVVSGGRDCLVAREIATSFV